MQVISCRTNCEFRALKTLLIRLALGTSPVLGTLTVNRIEVFNILSPQLVQPPTTHLPTLWMWLPYPTAGFAEVGWWLLGLMYSHRLSVRDINSFGKNPNYTLMCVAYICSHVFWNSSCWHVFEQRLCVCVMSIGNMESLHFVWFRTCLEGLGDIYCYGFSPSIKLGERV
jgi:hypothetical protein